MVEQFFMIPFSKADINEDDINSVNEVIRSGWLTHGKYSQAFEEEFAKFTRSKYAISVSNCTAGLHLSCMSLGLMKGDEVIVPAQTHTATAHAVELTGAKVVFADVESTSANISIADIKSKITERTKAIIPVHMAGVPCKMDDLIEISESKNIKIIEDCAHALGTKFGDTHVGNFGITGNFSFYPTKQITTGEGGMVITNDKAVYEYIKAYKAFGINTPPEDRSKPGVYDVQGLGLNYRMTDFQAALGLGQIKRYSANLESRKKNARLYEKYLGSNTNLSFVKFSEDNSYFLFQIILNEEFKRDDLLKRLKENKIGFSIHYATPVPLMSFYKNKYSLSSSGYPNACFYANQSVSLPVHKELSNDDILLICNIINDFTN